jgi:hypothetical protein
MRTQPDPVAKALTARTFVSEVEAFREELADPSVLPEHKARTYALIVRHAALLDPGDVGFERAGVALKIALCAWLDARAGAAH